LGFLIIGIKISPPPAVHNGLMEILAGVFFFFSGVGSASFPPLELSLFFLADRRACFFFPGNGVSNLRTPPSPRIGRGLFCFWTISLVSRLGRRCWQLPMFFCWEVFFPLLIGTSFSPTVYTTSLRNLPHFAVKQYHFIRSPLPRFAYPFFSKQVFCFLLLLIAASLCEVPNLSRWCPYFLFSSSGDVVGYPFFLFE